MTTQDKNLDREGGSISTIEFWKVASAYRHAQGDDLLKAERALIDFIDGRPQAGAAVPSGTLGAWAINALLDNSPHRMGAQEGQGGLTLEQLNAIDKILANFIPPAYLSDIYAIAARACYDLRARLARQSTLGSAPQADASKGLYWFDVLAKCARLLDLPDDEPIPSGVLKAVEALTAAPQEQAASRAAVPEGLMAIGRLLKTQDNRWTDQPMFVVQQRRRITGLDTDYCDNIIWLCAEDEYSEASEDEAAKLEAEYQETGRERSGWTRTGYMDQWEFVTACFTEQGCKDYLERDGHNLKEPRIYADGSYRNEEFRAVRNWLMSLAAAPVAQEGTQTDEPEAPSAKQEKLRALADRIDHEKLWKRPLMYRDRLTDDQRDRLDAGVMLRRYADLMAPGRWLLLPPTGNVRFSAESLDKVTEMAKGDQERRAAHGAQQTRAPATKPCTMRMSEGSEVVRVDGVSGEQDSGQEGGAA